MGFEDQVRRIAQEEAQKASGVGRLKNEQHVENFVRERLDRELTPRVPYPPRFLTADLPTASADNEGLVVYVPDAAAGAKFQGSDGTAWVNLG